jgi:hypothetical protein
MHGTSIYVWENGKVVAKKPCASQRGTTTVSSHGAICFSASLQQIGFARRASQGERASIDGH